MKPKAFFNVALSLSLSLLGLTTLPATAKEPVINKIQSTRQQNSFNLMGDWSGSSDCPITIYEDNGENIKGNCDNGSYSHVFRGRYSNGNKISLIVTRKDPNNCETSVSALIQVIDSNHVKYSQEGWNGCGVRTRPVVNQDWFRVNAQN
ncbi:hypothetical protein H1Q63_01585 [Desmonostoc muscorum CCALA 125]|nr:hypothetical protein [Desmonostoc muscorum CCALA 125]